MSQRFVSESSLMKIFGITRGRAQEIRNVIKNSRPPLAIPGRDDYWMYPDDIKLHTCDRYKSVREWVRCCHNFPDEIVERQLEALNEILGTYGVEALLCGDGERMRDGRQPWVRYWGNTVLLYCNSGDTYKTTIAYEVLNDRFIVTSWGSWYEENMIYEGPD